MSNSLESSTRNLVVLKSQNCEMEWHTKLTKVDVLGLKSCCQKVMDVARKKDEKMFASCAICRFFLLKYMTQYPKRISLFGAVYCYISSKNSLMSILCNYSTSLPQSNVKYCSIPFLLQNLLVGIRFDIWLEIHHPVSYILIQSGADFL